MSIVKGYWRDGGPSVPGAPRGLRTTPWHRFVEPPKDLDHCRSCGVKLPSRPERKQRSGDGSGRFVWVFRCRCGRARHVPVEAHRA